MKKFLLVILLLVVNYHFYCQNAVEDKTNLKNWYQKDYDEDKILGISLEKFYKTEKAKKYKTKKIIVAVIDTELDISHEDLKEAIWINKNEISNNGIDDDHNGYIDDVNGWNFLGNKKGESIIFSNLESQRILKELSKKKVLSTKDSVLFNKVRKMNSIENENAINIVERAKKTNEDYIKSLISIKQIYPTGDYNYNKIDSIYNLSKTKDDQFTKELKALRYSLKYNLNKDWFENNLDNAIQKSKTTYNPEFYDRNITGDDENNLKDKFYGSNNVSKNSKKVWHSTQVSGIIAAKRDNNIGIQGFGNQIKIMPVVAVPIGYENDKDIALAIYYAVDNGAKVINMSFGKDLSMHEDWVKKAIKYAEKKDVLIVHSAGNDAKNTDGIPNFPINYDQETNETFCNNFITVGGTTSNIEKLVFIGTNYGMHVDILAPSYELYVTDAIKGYTINSGTSLGSAVVSGAAALIRSHYPKLTASQVKQIILDSGTAYDLDVIVPGTKDKKVKFSELSKSGKVLNVYNAMKMAEGMSRKKKTTKIN